MLRPDKRPWLKIDCPKCGVPAGTECVSTQGAYTFCCYARSMNYTLPERLLPQNPRKVIGRRLEGHTMHCHRQNHEKCSGLHRSRHGMRCYCTCLCHRQKKVA